MISFDLHPAPNGNTIATHGPKPQKAVLTLAAPLLVIWWTRVMDLSKPWEMRREGRKGHAAHRSTGSPHRLLTRLTPDSRVVWWARHPRDRRLGSAGSRGGAATLLAKSESVYSPRRKSS